MSLQDVDQNHVKHSRNDDADECASFPYIGGDADDPCYECRDSSAVCECHVLEAVDHKHANERWGQKVTQALQELGLCVFVKGIGHDERQGTYE